MNLDPVFDAAGRSWNVDPDLLRAMARQESAGNDSAVSPAGARGRMQVMPDTFRGLGGTDINDPVQNIYAGAKYMSQGLDAEKGNPQQALLYYHGGPDWRSKYGPESAAYVPGVSAHYQTIQAAHAKGGADVPKQAQAPAAADDDEAAGKALIDQLTAGAGKPAAPPQGQPSASAAPANDDDEAVGRALVDRLTGPTKTAEPAKTAETSAPDVVTDSEGHPVSDTEGPADVIKRDIAALPEPVKRVGGAMADAWHAPNPLMTPELQRMIEAGGVVGRYITSPLLQAGGWAMGGAGALTAGGMAAANEVAGGGPLGRDVAQMLQLMPEVQRAGGLPGQATVPQAGPRNALAGVDRPYLTPEASADIAASRPNMLRADANETSPTGVPQFGGGPQMAERPPSPGMGAPQPQSGGAAVPAAGEVVDGWRRMTPGEPMVPGQEVATDAHGQQWVRADGAPQPRAAGAAGTPYTQSQMTPDEIIANRHVAEKDWLNRTIQPGVEDNRVLVEGNNPTLAQREQNAATSREQKSLTQQNPQLAQEEQELLDLHDTNRKRMYAQPDLAGSTVLLNNAEKAANDKLKAGLNAAFAKKTAADAQPVVSMADKFLSGREGKRAAIETEVKSVRTRLFDDEGKLETDPEILWGVREHINDVLSKENQRQNPVSGRAQSVLIAMRDKLDEVIDPAAPGFTKAIKGYAEEMKAPDVMRALQERENGLYDSKGRMQFSRFHSLMRDIVDARQPGAALSPFQHISDEQMVKLQNLHDDLKRAATAQDLAAAKGSDSAQNLWDAARTYAKGRGTAAINMIPYLGGLVRHGQEAYAPYKEMKAQQNALNRGIEMLRPPPDKYPTRNPLGD